MIRAGVGLSTASDTHEAARESLRRALSGLEGERPDLCVVFTTVEHRHGWSEGLAAIAEASGTPYIVGCSASGVIAEGVEIEDGPAVGVLALASDTLSATPCLFHDGGDRGLTAGVRLGQRMVTSRGSHDLLLVWPDPFTVHPHRLLRGIDATLGGVPVAGGAASAAASADTFQFSGEEIASRAVSGVRLGGDFRHRIAVSQGCRPVGCPLRVTGAHENLVLELDGRPAIERLREIVPDDLLDDPERAQDLVSVALLPDPADAAIRPGEFLVRNIIAADPDTGVLGIADVVEEGQRLVFALREPGAARDDMARALARIAAEGAALRYRFGLYFDCLARGSSLYGKTGVDSEMLGRALPGVPVLGFFCNAEMAPMRGVNQLFTYTGVLVLVAD